jgi:hypothetical protein
MTETGLDAERLRAASSRAFNDRDLAAVDEVFASDVIDRSVARAEDQVGLAVSRRGSIARPSASSSDRA